MAMPLASNASKLAETPGLTELQSATGAAVQAVCVALIPTNTPVSNPVTAEQDLFNQCSAMVHTGNKIQDDGTSNDPTFNNLGLSAEELGSALQNVATEEMATPSRISMNTLSGQVAQVNSHLFDVHKISQGFGGSGGDDEGSFLTSGFSTFVNGVGGFGEVDRSSRENSADFYSAGVIVGVDYRFNNNFVAGLAGGYSYLDADFDNSFNVSGGGVDADIYNVSLFASYDLENFYVDGNFTYGWSDYDVDRGVVVLSNNSASTGGANRVAKSSPDGEQYSAGLGFGYNHNHEAFNIRPYARLDYYHGNIDSYKESGAFGLNLAVDEQNFESLQSVLGTQLSYTFSHSLGVIIPQINFGWNHEFLNKSREINARYTADPNNFTLTAVTNGADNDFFTLGAGVSSVLQGGTQLYFNYTSLLGYSNVESHSFEAGFRLEF
jgi:outer membrane autotransporter protein